MLYELLLETIMASILLVGREESLLKSKSPFVARQWLKVLPLYAKHRKWPSLKKMWIYQEPETTLALKLPVCRKEMLKDGLVSLLLDKADRG